MKSIFIIITATILNLSALLSAQANGSYPRTMENGTGEYAGWRCNTPAKGSGITAGFFRGWEQTAFQDRGDGLMPVERFRCFKTVPECKTWLKTMTYLYNEKSIDASMCTKF